MNRIFSYRKLFSLMTEKNIIVNFSNESIENLIKIANNNNLNENEILKIIDDCIEYGRLDYIKLAVKAKKLKENRVTKNKKTNKSKLVQEFESATFEQFLRKLNNGFVSTSELKMMFKLKEMTKLESSVINVLVGHGINENKGSVPSLQYFLKIASDWSRRDITTTEKAVENVIEYRKKRNEYKLNPLAKQNTYVKNKYKQKVDTSPKWVDQAIEDLFKEDN